MKCFSFNLHYGCIEKVLHHHNFNLGQQDFNIIFRTFSSRPQRRYSIKGEAQNKKVKQQTKNILPMKQKQPHKEDATHCDHHQDHKKIKINKASQYQCKRLSAQAQARFQHCYTYITLRTNRGKYSKKPTLARVSITHIRLLV